MFAALAHDDAQRHELTEDFPGQLEHVRLSQQEALRIVAETFVTKAFMAKAFE